MLSKEMYSTTQYFNDIDTMGLAETWNRILQILEENPKGTGIITVDNIGELYEMGLAHVNKTDKKKNGQYFTPEDVAAVMADWLVPLKGANVCDVCCGTGNLILAYLKCLGSRKAKNLLKDGRLYLYDLDPLALHICKRTISILYGKELENEIHCYAGDFLSSSVHLPEDCKVISNPPYFKITNPQPDWEQTDVLLHTKEFYSVIMEKIIAQSNASVIITPYSFIGGSKFYALRQQMNQHNGFIVSFDNVPGNIFNGKKHGVFNSNTSNSVRAAITVVENKGRKKGFRCSDLIRFKNEEREQVLNTEYLETRIGSQYQVVTAEKSKYVKCHPAQEEILSLWQSAAKGDVLSDLLADGDYTICVPNSCRYFTVGAVRDLSRTGKNTLTFDDKYKWAYAYCVINSSFCYWHWRLYDGGITYPVSLLHDMPSVYSRLSQAEKDECLKVATEMSILEANCLSYKKNAGVMQENIKFPCGYREQINQNLLQCIGASHSQNIFNLIHSNSAVTNSEEDSDEQRRGNTISAS